MSAPTDIFADARPEELVAAYNEAHPFRMPFIPWRGDRSPPADWDEGEVLTFDFTTQGIRPVVEAKPWATQWRRSLEYVCVIGYRKREQPAPSDDVVRRMIACVSKIAEQPGHVQQHVARAILAEIEPEPVDPLVEAVQAVLNYANGAEYVPLVRAEELRAELAKRGLTIAKADSGLTKQVHL